MDAGFAKLVVLHVALVIAAAQSEVKGKKTYNYLLSVNPRSLTTGEPTLLGRLRGCFRFANTAKYVSPTKCSFSALQLLLGSHFSKFPDLRFAHSPGYPCEGGRGTCPPVKA